LGFLFDLGSSSALIRWRSFLKINSSNTNYRLVPKRVLAMNIYLGHILVLSHFLLRMILRWKTDFIHNFQSRGHGSLMIHHLLYLIKGLHFSKLGKSCIQLILVHLWSTVHLAVFGEWRSLVVQESDVAILVGVAYSCETHSWWLPHHQLWFIIILRCSKCCIHKRIINLSRRTCKSCLCLLQVFQTCLINSFLSCLSLKLNIRLSSLLGMNWPVSIFGLASLRCPVRYRIVRSSLSLKLTISEWPAWFLLDINLMLV